MKHSRLQGKKSIVRFLKMTFLRCAAGGLFPIKTRMGFTSRQGLMLSAAKYLLITLFAQEHRQAKGTAGDRVTVEDIVIENIAYGRVSKLTLNNIIFFIYSLRLDFKVTA